MDARKNCPTLVGGCLAVFAACVFAQAPATNTNAPAASTAQPATSTTGTPEQRRTTPAAAPATTHHAMKHKTMHSAHANPSSGNMHEDPYRMALRQCVQGPEAQRDRCLDDAISRFGRS